MAFALPLFTFLFILLPSSLLAQTNNATIQVNDSLTAGDPQAGPWISPSGDFAFGFRELETQDLYLLAIWYNNIRDRDIVWYANMKSDPAVPPNSKVTLTSERGLVLNDPQGNSIWRSGISTSEASGGFLNDTGNFVVSDRNGQKLWQSFDDPTDTLLPTQVMEVNGVLSSRLTRNNFSRGRFQFRLLGDGNAVLNTINPANLANGFAYDAYFWSNTFDGTNSSNSGRQVMFNESGYLYVIRANNQTKLLAPEDTVLSKDYYYRATLNFDGVFVIYKHPKTSIGNWSIVRAMPENICTAVANKELGTGPCGYNGFCTLSVDYRPICKCPTRFSLLDSNDEYGGCKPDFPTQVCDGSIRPEDYTFQELFNVNWVYGDYERYENYDNEKCQQACREDCFCNLVILGGSTCWKKRLPLTNGRQDVSVGGIAYLKIPPTDSATHPPDKKNSNETLIIVMSVLLGCSVLAIFLLMGCLSYGFMSYYHNKIVLATQSQRTVESNVRSFSYKELEEATNGFKEELGRGSFGIVYKGVMEISARTAIAVKKLDRVIRESEKEFKTEVDVIAQTHHKNLLRLIGYCDEGQHRMLVYEFVSNGTLAQFLFGDIKLRWEQRIQIAFGVAKGLLYLHDECSTQIIHCDIKPQNILLDDNYNVKIADFGLAKLLLRDKSNTLTAIRGTKGYVAAEWYRNLPITAKVDVYSFGVVLLEIICCRRNVNEKLDDERAILTDWVYDCYLEGTIEALVDDDEEALADKKRLESFVKIGIWCIQEEPNLRPTMKQVVLMLEGIIQVPVPPCPYQVSIVS